MGNDVDMWEMAKIAGKWLKYLTNGLNVWKLIERFCQMFKIFLKWHRDIMHGLSICGTA